MRKASIIGGATWLAMLGFCLPASMLAAAPPVGRSPAVIDLALRDDGRLLGQVVDPKGNAIADTPVALWYQNQEIGTSRTDPKGAFAFRDLRGGVHQVAAAEGLQTYRFWAPGTAPPTAQPSALVVARSATVPEPMPQPMSQPMPATVTPFFGRPWVVGGIAGGLIATAISVPIALSNTNETTPTSP